MNSIVELSLVIQPCFYILKEPTILEFTYTYLFLFSKHSMAIDRFAYFFATISMPKFATTYSNLKNLFLWFNILIIYS